jgi:RNA recognition motif 2/RNA recognition motif. (a.k.a. RRM, RBD, or RNP domain)
MEENGLRCRFTFLEEADEIVERPRKRSLSCPSFSTYDDVSTTNEEEEATPSISDQFWTTIMLRHIPNKYSQPCLLRAIDQKGFKGAYDFFYLPADFRNAANVGYAFINLRSHEIALAFIDAFTGYRLPALRSSKVCDVSWARIQGIDANVAHYRNNPVNSLSDPLFRPLVFDAYGDQMEFPKPDKKRRPPMVMVMNHNPSDRWPPIAQQHRDEKIFVGGLAIETSEKDLRSYFEKFGQVTEAAIVSDKKTGQSRGFGFCCFKESDSVDKVLSVRQHLIHNQSVGVRRYSNKK